MPYGHVTVERIDGRIVIVIDPPHRGEPSASGRSENLVDPSKWIRYDASDEYLALKMTVCRPHYRRSDSRVE
jgi:hypothetical protein